ncbi:MAG: DNA pilot protein [Microviridae sp.]|nr:MAG: DNA pilot protein [Microviridae sp.]
MPFPVGAAIAAGASLAGQGIQMQGAKLSNTKNYNRTRALMDKQFEQNQAMALFNNQQQMEMWEKTGPQGQMEQLKKAGLNPSLIYGMGGAGGQTAQAAQGGAISQGGFKGENPAAGAAQTGAIIGQQLALITAQKENIEADTQNKLAEIPNKKATTPNIEADTENKILQQVINNYAGKEAKDTYEKVTSPNRGIQAKTYEDELSARQGIAGNIYEMWINGQLAEKSTAEIEQLLVGNAKTRTERQEIEKKIDLLEQNIKGAKLDNIIKDLEARLQKQTGIDRNSPGWLKILGRLFVELIGNPGEIIKGGM